MLNSNSGQAMGSHYRGGIVAQWFGLLTGTEGPSLEAASV